MQTHPDSPETSTAEDAAPSVSLLDLVYVLAANLRLLIGLPFAAAVLAVGASFLMKPVFTASITILPPQQQQSSAMALLGSLGGLGSAVGGGGAGLSALAGLKNPNDQWIGLLKSRTIADAIVQQFDLKSRYAVEMQFEARDELALRTKIEAGKDNLISVSVEDTDPKQAAAMSTAYIDELRKMMKTLAVTEAAQRRVFFERQLQEAKANLIKAETALKASGVNADVLKTSPIAAVDNVVRLRAQIALLEVRLGVLRGSRTENSPEMQQTLLELASLRTQLRKAEAADTPGSNGDSSDYIARYREFKYQETLFELLARQYEIARADESREGNLIQVVDPSSIPEHKSRPKRASLGILVLLATGLLTLIYVFARQALRNARTDPIAAAKLHAIGNALRRRA